jgi:hypothetical protein
MSTKKATKIWTETFCRERSLVSEARLCRRLRLSVHYSFAGLDNIQLHNPQGEAMTNEGNDFPELQHFLRNLGPSTSGKPLTDKHKLLATQAVLTSVQVIYYTRNDNKDSDTRLECWINMAGEREAAYNQTYGQFDDWSTHVLYLSPKSNLMRKSDISGSWLQTRIAPNGNDTWRFTCDCTLHFSDGSIHHKRFLDPTTLDQGATQSNKYL